MARTVIPRSELTADFVRSVLHYDPETGEFRWRAKAGRYLGGQKIGGVAGTTNKAGYIQITIAGNRLYAHRLAWLCVYGEWPEVIDHINGDCADNRIANLRNCTQGQNMTNARRRSNNTSGCKGIHYRADKKVWSARITAGGEQHNIGCFPTREAAREALIAAAQKIVGEFARYD